MSSSAIWPLATTLIGGVATLAIFSFMIRENRFYRIFEHLFIGIASGYTILVGIRLFLWPQIIRPILGLDIYRYPDGTPTASYNSALLLYLIPIGLGLLYYTVYSPRLSWLSKVVIGISLGASAGIYFKGFFAEMVPQLTSSWKPLVVFGDSGAIDWGASFSNTFFVATLTIVMFYFFFSFRTEGRVARATITAGRWLMMVCFGAFFGSTVMARMALLVERLQFLLVDWFNAVATVSRGLV